MSKLNSRLSVYMRPHLIEAARFKSKMKNLLFVTLLFGVGFSVLARADVPAVTEAMRERAIISPGDPARLDAVLSKARRGEPICVAAIGGSITAGGEHTKDPKRRYVQQLAKWFEDTFPGLKVRFVNAGIGATSSNYGALRVKHDVLDQHPDLVVVEYAVNDTVPVPSLGDSYEGVLRQLLSSSKDLAVIELFFMHKDGKSAREVQEQLGRHYGLPMISFREAMWPEFQSGRLKWEDFYDDVVHPSNEGHDVTSELLRGFLTSSLAKLPASGKPIPEVSNLTAPMITNIYERCVLFRGEDLKPISSPGWTHHKPNVWECASAGGTLEYEIPGQILHLGLTVPAAAKTNIQMVVDGAQSVPVSTAVNYRPVAIGLSGGQHNVKLIVRPYQATTNAANNNVQLWWVGAAGVGAP